MKFHCLRWFKNTEKWQDHVIRVLLLTTTINLPSYLPSLAVLKYTDDPILCYGKAAVFTSMLLFTLLAIYPKAMLGFTPATIPVAHDILMTCALWILVAKWIDISVLKNVTMQHPITHLQVRMLRLNLLNRNAAFICCFAHCLWYKHSHTRSATGTLALLRETKPNSGRDALAAVPLEVWRCKWNCW